MTIDRDIMLHDLSHETGFWVKLWVVDKPLSLGEPRSEQTVVGYVCNVYADHLYLNYQNSNYAEFYFDKIVRYQRMPHPGHFSTILQNARIHQESAVEAWPSDPQNWTVGACIQDVRKLLEVIEVMEGGG